MVERLFLVVPRGCLQFVIVVFPDHTHLLFLKVSSTELMEAILSRLGMSVTTQGGSGRQYVTGSRRNISKYRFVLLNVYRFRET